MYSKHNLSYQDTDKQKNKCQIHLNVATGEWSIGMKKEIK